MLLYLKYSIKHAPESLNFQVVEKYLWICATKLRQGSCGGKLPLVLCRVLRERFSAFTDDLCEDICTACNYGWHVWWLCHHRGKQEAEWSDTKVGLIWKKKQGKYPWDETTCAVVLRKPLHNRKLYLQVSKSSQTNSLKKPELRILFCQVGETIFFKKYVNFKILTNLVQKITKFGGLKSFGKQK